MTEEIDPPPPPRPNPARSTFRKPPPIDYEPLEGGCSLPNLANKILKRPLSLIHEIENTNNGYKIISILFIMAVFSFALFGLVVGMFSWGTQLWAAPMKIVGGMLFSSMICLPSLYIFTCMGGLDGKFVTVFGMMGMLIALAGLLLIGFAPVVWLFSTSSNSIPFVGFLVLVIWLISVGICLALVFRAGQALGMNNTFHLSLWCGIFLLVTLQMTTTLRPIIGNTEELFHFTEKKGFLEHWANNMSGNLYDEPKTRQEEQEK
jgi:hypothetical protein